MPSSRTYQYSAVDMKTVMSNPEEFIIPENLEACKLLWSKNIFTKMNNNYDNDYSWITISRFSPENQQLFDALSAYDNRFGLTYGGIGFKVPVVPGKGNDTFEAFRVLIEFFPMQDVQKDGCMTFKEFMIYYTDCYRMGYTPEYEELTAGMMSPDGDVLIYNREFEKYMNYNGVRRRVRVFDPSKMTKPLEEYIADSIFAGLYDPDNGMVYYNDMYYQAHMRYKAQQKKTKTPKLA